MKMRAVEPITLPINISHVQSRLGVFTSSIKRLSPGASVKCGNVIVVQQGKSTWYDFCGNVHRTEQLPNTCTAQEWFADIEIDNCTEDLCRRLKMFPWDDGKMIVFELAPISMS